MDVMSLRILLNHQFRYDQLINFLHCYKTPDNLIIYAYITMSIQISNGIFSYSDMKIVFGEQNTENQHDILVN